MKENTKVIAFYLPQYHRVKENSEWWGEGFTEWTNVKKGEPLFKGHYQPKVPYHDNYYDLSNIEAIVEQVKYAKKYGVDGFCFYHYWFEGKKLLEKPIESLLQHKEINISFCISWANETWSRRWNGEEKNILIKQTYGGQKDWEEHFQYLLQFFQDDRYIKIENKPVLLLYRTFEIEQYDEMIAYWNRRLIEEGFEGGYLIETLNSVQKRGYSNNSVAYVQFEPMYTIYSHIGYIKRIYRYLFHHLRLSDFGFRDYISYDFVWKRILKRKNIFEKKCYLGAFPEWDNTARKGKAGLVIKDCSPEKFEKYFSAQYKKSIELENEFIFINAWNEWGEGAYLEPDKRNEFKYLEAIKRVVNEY